MRRVALLCSALFLISAATAEAQPRLKRDDTPAPAAAAQKNAKSAKSAKPERRAAKRSRAAKEDAKPAADTRPRLKRDDTPAAVATAPSAAEKKGARRASRGKPHEASAPQASAPSGKATMNDIKACALVAQPDAAIEGCTRVIEDGKQKPKSRGLAYFNRGNALAAKGDQAAAIADYDEAIKLDPKNASAYNNRGSAKNDQGASESAVADFDAAIKQNKRYAAAYFNRASAYAAQGDARAMKDYEAALRYNPRNANAYIARGALLLASGATAKARADIARAAKLDRSNAYAVLWHDIAERRAKQKGVLAGGKGLKDVEMKGWPAPVLLMAAGELKFDGVLEAAEETNAARKQAHTCEANFYGGQYALVDGKRDDAVKLFRTAAKDCPHGFLEGIAAAAELKGMGEKAETN